MIKLEDIRKAIQAISKRDPEIGFALDELLGVGRIQASGDQDQEGDPYFWFDQEKVKVKKISYFNEGIVPLEQRLLLKFGELAHKETMSSSDMQQDYLGAAYQVHNAGLDFLVRYELDYALNRLNQTREAYHFHDQSGSYGLGKFLQQMRLGQQVCSLFPQDNPCLIYNGAVNVDTPASLMYFPYSFEALKQVADLNLDFFHPRFVLNCLLEGAWDRLLSCVVAGRIVGMCFLTYKTGVLYTGLEIEYIATIGGKKEKDFGSTFPRVKGAGSLLVAGVWVLWQSKVLPGREIILDSELEARGFYKRLGFEYRPPAAYILKSPRGPLLLSILSIFLGLKDPQPSLVKAVRRVIEKQAKALAGKKELDRVEQKNIQIFLARIMTLEDPQDLVQQAIGILAKKAGKSQVARELLYTASEAGLIETEQRADIPGQTLVLCDHRYEEHLQGIFHLENPGRIKAVFDLLADDALQQADVRWVSPRLASEDELAGMHSREYLDRLRQSQDKRLFAFDLDTQTTPSSYQTARLAVGGVFSLLDAILAEKKSRGFAFVRPPGHHAERDKAMGFCLLNNCALGALYALDVRGLSRIMIIDVDAHHGNGIQKAFYQDDRVLYVSLHQYPAYPGTGNLGEVGQDNGLGFNVNIPLSAGQKDLEYARILHYLVRPLSEAFQPELIIVPMGFDLYLHDPLAGMRVSSEGYALMTYLLLKLADKVCSGKIAFVMEGGYSLDGIRHCGLKCMRVLAGLEHPSTELLARISQIPVDKIGNLQKVIKVQKQYWQSLP